AVMIKNLPVVRRADDLRAAHAEGADWMVTFEPIDDVEIVNVLLDDVITANPDEVIPIAHLVFHFRELTVKVCLQFEPGMAPGASAVPVGTGGDKLADRAVLEALERFVVADLMMPLQSDAHGQFLLLGNFVRL